jgi:CheY-like chemotaxis protein
MASMRDFKVLVVDDERDSRVLVAHYLEEFGCQVVTAANGEEALAAAREHKPDLMTLDLIMPGLTGWEVLKRLKADPELRRIPVVIISVVAGEGRGRLLGAVDLVTKPFEREDLLRVLWRNVLRRSESRILVVVRDDSERERIGAFLGRRGLAVVAAADTQEALDAVRTEAPHAMLLDLSGAAEDGLPLLRSLRENRMHAGLPVLVLTSDQHTASEREELEELATVVVRKEQAAERLDSLLGTIFPFLDKQEAQV